MHLQAIQDIVEILFDAIKHGDLNTVKSFGDFWIVRNGDRQTAMHIAVLFGQMQIFDFLLTNFPKMVTQPTEILGKTVLHYAVDKEDMDIVKKLVLFSMDLIDIPDRHGCTPLQCAVESGRWNIVSFMISQKPDSVHQTTIYGDTLLHLAAGRFDDGMVRGLLTVCPPKFLTITNRSHHTPLSLAIQIGCVFDIVKSLIDADPTAIDIPDLIGVLPIFASTTLQVITYLLSVCPHAIRHKKAWTHSNLLHWACDRENSEITNMLLQSCPALLYEKTMNGDSPLHVAIRNIDYAKEHANKILRFNPDLVDNDNDGNTVLHLAVKAQCDLDVVRDVFQKCVSNLCCTNIEGETPMCFAVETRNKDVVAMFQPHMTTDMAIALNDSCLERCGVNLQTYTEQRCVELLNNHLLPDITHVVLDILGITKKRKR